MAKQHVHKYRRIDIGRDKPYWVMQCSLPGCNSYTHMRTIDSCPQLVDKMSLCNKCGDRFILTRKSLQMAKPKCDSCIVSVKKKGMDKAAKFFNELEEILSDDTI